MRVLDKVGHFGGVIEFCGKLHGRNDGAKIKARHVVLRYFIFVSLNDLGQQGAERNGLFAADER
jgi:hypothetical protein